MSDQRFLFPSLAYTPVTVTALPLREQPIERALANASNCSSIELLSVLIGGPKALETAQLVMVKFSSLHDVMHAGVTDLIAVRGISKTSAVRIKAALQLGLRAATETSERLAINCPADAATIFRRHFADKDQECLYVMLLDTRNRIIRDPIEVYRGSLNSVMIRVGELFREAIRWNASAIILAHNHPSTDPSPSPDDVAMTRMAVESGKMLDIPLHDHLIIGGGSRFVSLKERGLGFS